MPTHSAPASGDADASEKEAPASARDRTGDAAQTGPEDAPDASFVDTGQGIVTERGRWYHASTEMLEAYAGEVFEHVPLDTLLRQADQWGEAPRTVTLWALPLILFAVSPSVAAIAAAAGYLILRLAMPSFPSPTLARIAGGGQWVVVQATYYGTTLSVLAVNGDLAAMGVGLAGFAVLRWGLLRRLTDPVVEPLLQRLYPLPVTDQILRGLIVRVALRHRLQLSQLDDVAHDIFERWGPSADADEAADDDPPSQSS